MNISSSTGISAGGGGGGGSDEDVEEFDDPIVNLTYILLPLLFIVALGLGATLNVQNFKAVWSDPLRRRAFLVCTVAHWVLMPPISYALCFIFDLSRERSIGLVIVGCMAIGSSSSLFAYWAKGDLALSVAIGLTSTIMGFGLVPGMMYAFITQTGLAGTLKVDYTSTAVALILLAVPVAIGICIRQYNTEKTVQICGKKLWIWQCFEKGGSIIGAIFLVIAVTIGIIDNIELLSEKWTSWIAPFVLQPIGHVVMYIVGRVAQLRPKEYRTISLQNGILNSTLAIAICTLSFPDTKIQRLVLTCPLFYSLWYVIHTAWITPVYWYVATHDPNHEYESVVPDAPDSPQSPSGGVGAVGGATSPAGVGGAAGVGGGSGSGIGAANDSSAQAGGGDIALTTVTTSATDPRVAATTTTTPRGSARVTIHVPTADLR